MSKLDHIPCREEVLRAEHRDELLSLLHSALRHVISEGDDTLATMIRAAIAKAEWKAERDELLAVIARIGRMSAPGTRTLDDFIRDMGWINDETRRIAKARGYLDKKTGALGLRPPRRSRFKEVASRED